MNHVRQQVEDGDTNENTPKKLTTTANRNMGCRGPTPLNFTTTALAPSGDPPIPNWNRIFKAVENSVDGAFNHLRRLEIVGANIVPNI